MKKEIKTYGTVCDSCNIELIDSGIRTNGGRFEEPYLTHGKVDLCYNCAGKVFYREVFRKVPEEKLKEWIKSLKKTEGSNPLGPDLEEVEVDLFHKSNKDTNSLDTSLDDLPLAVPHKTVSTMKFLEDL